jgi:hypothetical protein
VKSSAKYLLNCMFFIDTSVEKSISWEQLIDEIHQERSSQIFC